MKEQQQTESQGPMDGIDRGTGKGNGSNGAAGPPSTPPPAIRYAGEKTPLKDLRARLTAEERKIIGAAAQHIERHLIECWPEVVAGIRTTNREASFSATVQVKGVKKSRLRAVVSARVRTPREDLEIDLYMADDGQLALGLPMEEEEAEE